MSEDPSSVLLRPHPQVTFRDTVVEPDSFFGAIRQLYSGPVLKAQLDRLHENGSYDVFGLKWHPKYDEGRLHGAKYEVGKHVIALHWDCQVAKWIEAVCYFLSSPDGKTSPHAALFQSSVEELVGMIERAQQPDGYLCVYFIVVDPQGKMKNLRDRHEMFSVGHMTEAALAHYHWSGSRRYLDVMIKCVDLWMSKFGPEQGQLHGYPGHPELELAMFRLYAATRDPRHLAWGRYLLDERGRDRADQDGLKYFEYEAKLRGDPLFNQLLMPEIDRFEYMEAHAPIHEQNTVQGHAVRVGFLLTACADHPEFLDDARRLWTDAVDHKMYIIGGFGSKPASEGFSPHPYRLPQHTGEGGCYTETCASISFVMASERLLSHSLDGKVRDVMELCLYNGSLGGGALDGTAFNYENHLATFEDESDLRKAWFGVSCCPPNLSRTIGIVGGYAWGGRVDAGAKRIYLDVYLFISATRTFQLGQGAVATVRMTSKMPWTGESEWAFEAPQGWEWEVCLPKPGYAMDVVCSTPSTAVTPGYLKTVLPARSSCSLTFSLPVRLLRPHPLTNLDVLYVSRGPLVYTAESADNVELDAAYPHFAGVGFPSAMQFVESDMTVSGFHMIRLQTAEQVYGWGEVDDGPFEPVGNDRGRQWVKTAHTLKYIPWFARSNRGGAGRMRTGMLRVDDV